MRDRDTIDSELRQLVAVRRTVRERGGEVSTRQVDDLLDERLGHRFRTSESEAVEPDKTTVVADDSTDGASSYARKGVLHRFRLLAALPLSLVVAAAAFAVMYAVHDPHPAAGPPIAPPQSSQPTPPASEPPNPAAPTKNPPRLDLIDRAFIDVLKQLGVPVPSNEYAMSHGHAVCDFLTRQPDFAEAAHFVQGSSVWDIDQSTEFTTAAIASYCPRLEPATNLDQMEQTFQDVLSGLQAIEGELRGIRDHLPAAPDQ